MRIYLGRFEKLLEVTMVDEPANQIDPSTVCIQMVAEHASVAGDFVTFRVGREDVVKFHQAYLAMVASRVPKP